MGHGYNKLFRLHMHINNALRCARHGQDEPIIVPRLPAPAVCTSIHHAAFLLILSGQIERLSIRCFIFIMTKKSKPALACIRLAFLCLSPTSFFGCAVCLVADADEVVGELLHSVGRNSRLDGLGVVGDKHGLVGLDDDDTFSAL